MARGPGNRHRGEGGLRVAPRCSHSGNRRSRWRLRGRCRRWPRGGSGARQRRWRRGIGRWGSRSAGGVRWTRRWPAGHTGSSWTRRGTPPRQTRKDGRRLGKRAGGKGGEDGHARGKQRRVEEQGAGGATVASQPETLSPEPTPTDWGSESPLPQRYVRRPARRVPWTVQGWRAGDVAELVRYVKWAGRTRGGQERRGICTFRDLVHRAGTGAGEGGGQVGDDAGRGAPGGGPGVSQGTGEKAQGADAEGPVAEGGVVLSGTWARRWHGIGRGRRGSAWATGCRAWAAKGARRAEER